MEPYKKAAITAFDFAGKGVDFAVVFLTTDFLTKRVVKKGIVPQYYVEESRGHHSPRAFSAGGDVMQGQARVETGTGKRRIYSWKYDLSNHVYCTHCGDGFSRIIQWFIKGERILVWRCVSRLVKRKADVDCPFRTIYEKDLHAAVVMAFNHIITMKDEFIPGMKLVTERALCQTNSPRVAEVDERLEAPQKGTIEEGEYKAGVWHLGG